MRKALILSALISSFLFAEGEVSNQTPVQNINCDCPKTATTCSHHNQMRKPMKQMREKSYKAIRISVTGQGVAPTMTASPAQAYALAKRAAIADAYRLIAEKVKGVRIEGSDKIKNMMVQRSEVRTFVDAVIAEAEIVETVFKDGLCEVEMELTIDPRQWQSILASR